MKLRTARSARATITVTYLASVVAANLTIAQLGPAAVLPVGFALIGLTLLTRDVFHELNRDQLMLRMAGLISTGAILSYVVNQGAARIAVASFLAFAASETVDALIYHRLLRREWLLKTNVSNLVSATVDSAVFIGVAFGALIPLMLAQSGVKVLGGALWSLLIASAWRRQEPA